MTKNLVTVSLMIFIIVIVGILGAAVFVKQNTTETPLGSSQGNNYSVPQITTNSNANNGQGDIVRVRDEDEDPDDEDGEGAGMGVGNTTKAPSTPTTPPSTTNPPVAGTVASSQVAQHNSRTNCWMIISGKVYNLTSYMTAHPGGISTILPLCGKDGTTAFDTKGGQGSHSQTAHNLLVNYYVGNLNK